MANDVTLTAAVRSNLLSLQNTSDLIARTQNRLSTGLRIASPLDDGRAFFEAKALTDRAADIAEKKDGIDQAINSVKVTLEAVESIDNLIKQMKGLATGAKSASGSELAAIVDQYNELRSQVDALANDASYQGVNLVNSTGNSLTVEFSTNTASVLTIQGVNIQAHSVNGLSINAAGTAGGAVGTFTNIANIDSAIGEIDTAIATLRGHAQALGSRVALLQTRLDFTDSYVNNLEEGAGKLTLADINEEGANLVALQTRQQLGISALAFAGQAEQAVLQLFQ